MKVFQGQGFDEFRKQMEGVFRSVAVRKPQASRGRSSEVYLLGSGKPIECRHQGLVSTMATMI